MKKAVGLTLFVCVSTWCTSGGCEENKLDPGVINGWMRSSITTDSDKNEVKRIVHSTTMDQWRSSRVSNHLRYEVMNSDCHRTLTIYATDEHGHSWTEDWVSLIELDAKRESSELEKPKVLVRSLIESDRNSPVMDLDVEYQLHDGLPALVVLDQRDVTRTVRSFKRGVSARVRVIAFEHDYEFTVDLNEFGDKAGWANEHCPLEDTQSRNTKETPAS
ncbi:MAG: hypothetical protein F4X44_11025 [Gammaproteobacteria bacterium]|nr:hypothetical protein [Gammaproteobacteria bacterium]MYD81129.1 hypothetical protein [Gammaproteobacteria bacterium]